MNFNQNQSPFNQYSVNRIRNSVENQPVPRALTSANNPYASEPYRKRFQPSKKISFNKRYFKTVGFWIRALGIVG